MRVLWIFLLVVAASPAAWADGKNCYVKITNPAANDMVLANQCIAFPDDMTESTYKMARGICQPEWDDMKVKVDYIEICPKSSYGKCRFTLNFPGLNFDYTVYYYKAPPATAQDNESSCLEGGGTWIPE